MFKRYDDASHWGVFIPIGRKKLIAVWDPAADVLRKPTPLRLHFCVTVKSYQLGFLREIRIRIGRQYL